MSKNAILEKMLDRLYAGLMKGPSLNCRPHSSRQRIDITALKAFDDKLPTDILLELLGGERHCSIAANVVMPESMIHEPFQKRNSKGSDTPAQNVREAVPGPLNPEMAPDKEKEGELGKAAERAWRVQKSLLTKLRNLSEESRTYEQDTGVHALNVGYPILSLPPGTMGGTKRILAPVAFIPVSLEVSVGRRPGIDLRCREQGIDLVAPNVALQAWLEREAGGSVDKNRFEDEQGEQPWREIADLIEWITQAFDIEQGQEPSLVLPDGLHLDRVPTAQELASGPVLLPCAVLGLFPASNQGLLRDMREMVESETMAGPVCSFIELGADLAASEHEVPDPGLAVDRRPRRFSSERFVARADPCQAQTVEMARTSTGLVIHGPPGTGKSQTITNIIGDHLAHGKRVLFVCDKRTALDVVSNRLEHMGLGGLCAVVHDPKRDQRDLYMNIRARLEELHTLKTHPRATSQLDKIDAELQSLYEGLSLSYHGLMSPPDENHDSFHELMGHWLGIKHGFGEIDEDDELDQITLEELEQQQHGISVLLDRACEVDYPSNIWALSSGIALDVFLARPVEAMRQALASCEEESRVADGTCDPRITPFDAEQSLEAQAAFREELAKHLAWIIDYGRELLCAQVAAMPIDTARQGARWIAEARPWRKLMGREPLDAELLLAVHGATPTLIQIKRDILDIDYYLGAVARWYAFMMFGAKRIGGRVLRRYGLPRSAAEAQRLRRFLIGLQARLMLEDLCKKLMPAQATLSQPVSDDEITGILEQYDQLLSARVLAEENETIASLFCEALSKSDALAQMLQGLTLSRPRARALAVLEASVVALDLLNPKFIKQFVIHVRNGRKAGENLSRLVDQFQTLESVLRVREGIDALPKALCRSAKALVDQGADGEGGGAALRQGVLAGEIRRRLASDSYLARIDGQRIDKDMTRCADLEAEKRSRVKDAVLHQWVSRQKKRLLATTGSRLNSAGADLRRRLFVRGKRAMRLRQVIAVGSEMEGGDPVFDMCPVWMASPETVAQVFPRREMFDVVIFDEASQCRLEEALPVLVRAKRVVIAGDPKQLPPTRFFEAAFSSSDEDEIETSQDLFEVQQGEVEDLLSAALNLEIHEAYLDVHYRSRNADLIEFSNQQFYHSRLQAIPGHPSNRSIVPPISLEQVKGIYDERCNQVEAVRVCEIVRDLLRRAQPPSIGIASFNLKQRDLIAEALDEMALDDEEFARQLAIARQRRGEGSFEGLFVKNLENVQGDERDHIIISTTYGPTPEGRFYRRFGPLQRSGGGRRLNVLVTRARHEVHLVTSIPQEVWQAHEPIPEGSVPTGGWLLFAYLRYADQLKELYREAREEQHAAQAAPKAHLLTRDIPPFSHFSHALGQHLGQEAGFGCDVHWGNTGFCIDAALHHPDRAEDVTLGVLCDFNRYPHAPDPVQWEIYRTGMLRGQGWQLHRVWSPQFFRDPQGAVRKIEQGVEKILMQEQQEQQEPS